MATILHCTLVGGSRSIQAILLGSIICTLVLIEPCAAQQNSRGGNQTGGTNNGVNIGTITGGTISRYSGGQIFNVTPPKRIQIVIDKMKIGQDISPAEGDRLPCIHGLVTAIYNRLGRQYNVLVHNAAQLPVLNSDNIVFQATATCGDGQFLVWAFRDGWIDHGGEMGYPNWEFMGRFERSGPELRHVVFYAR